jgi:hypothetical protein
MKTSNSISLTSVTPSLFQIAAFFEDFFPSGNSRPTPSSSRHLPVAEYMLEPEKLMRLLKSGRMESHAATVDEQEPAVAKRNSRGGVPKKQSDFGPGKPGGSNGSPKNSNPPTGTHRKVEFTLKSPSAGSVKLAGDFTQWEKAPVEMVHSKDGIWSTVIPLQPGVYTYRFIVDGTWCDDPRSDRYIPNPYGGNDAVRQVT